MWQPRGWAEGGTGGIDIDTGFDVRSDANGRDPDEASPTLRRFHRLLWSKPLPSGEPFELVETTRGAYLHHLSAVGEFFLASDSVMPTFAGWPAARKVIEQIPEPERESFLACTRTIGAMMVFPGRQIDRRFTINQARGMSRAIADRFDLTLECIRRHYLGEPSPLGDSLARYADFFALFVDFRGYVEFFLLQDLVDDAMSSVRFFLPFDDYRISAVPADLDSYIGYRRQSLAFIQARNRRIADA